MHYYNFNIKDWTRDTAHLSVEEEGVYRRLLDLYYESESPIPAETQSVIRRLRLGGHEKAVAIVLSEFFVLESDGYRNSRCDAEIAKYQAKAEANRLNGQKGGRPKDNHKTQNKPTNNPSGSQTETQINPNQEPRTKNQEPIETPLSPSGEKAKRKTKIPDPFMLTSEMRAWAAESAPAVDIRTETENFVDYWRGAGGTKLDWVATWRTWMRKSQQQSQQRPRGGYSGAPVNRQQQIEDANAKVLQEIIDLENQRQAGGQQSVIDLGQPITIEGGVI